MRFEDRGSRIIEDQGIEHRSWLLHSASHFPWLLLSRSFPFPLPSPPLPPRFDCKTRTIFARDRSGILRYRREDEWSEYGPFEAGSTALDSPPPCRLRDRAPTNRSPRLYFRIIRAASVASSQIRLCEKRRREAFC